MEIIKELSSHEDWQDAWESSMDSPLLIYKHSTSCMISARAFKHVKAFQKTKEDNLECYMVKVIENRAVSNAIAQDTTIPHKSPQILLINKQQVVWNISHWKITEQHIREAVNH